ncbi:MAG TPA: transcriptional regulator [Flavobacterium sp.]
MNYIKHLTGFFDRIVQDADLNPTHISLYVGLFQYWNINRFQNPISITRDEVMRISKIASKATYHKCMKDLHNKGYVKYEPSYNPFKGSMVILYNFADDHKQVQKTVPPSEKICSNNEQALNKQRTGYQTSTEQALVPSINYINNTNISNDLNLNEHAKNSENENSDLKAEDQKEKKSSAKKKELLLSQEPKTTPSLEEIKSYFLEQSFPELEAQKFFNHYSSNGWLIGGKSPMVDWKAAAQNWILNSVNFQFTKNDDRAGQLNVVNNKNYAEPL